MRGALRYFSKQGVRTGRRRGCHAAAGAAGTRAYVRPPLRAHSVYRSASESPRGGVALSGACTGGLTCGSSVVRDGSPARAGLASLAIRGVGGSLGSAASANSSSSELATAPLQEGATTTNWASLDLAVSSGRRRRVDVVRQCAEDTAGLPPLPAVVPLSDARLRSDSEVRALVATLYPPQPDGNSAWLTRVDGGSSITCPKQ